MIKAAQIGYGYWGVPVANVLDNLSYVSLDYIFDCDLKRQELAFKNHSKIKKVSSLEEILKKDVDVIFVITPPDSHYQIARQSLLADKHVFVEKPCTTNLNDAFDLVRLAEKKNKTLFVDHVLVYSEPVKYLKECHNKDEFGNLVYINARRINLGLFQYKVDVIWDLAIHDISIIDYLIGFDVKKMSVFKKKYKDFPNDAIANINADLKNGTTVSLNVSWLSPVKVREMIFGGTKKMAVFDDTAINQVQIYDHGIMVQDNFETDALYEKLVQYKIGKIVAPEIPKRDSLNNAIQHFLECVTENKEPLTGKESIIHTIQALEMISKI